MKKINRIFALLLAISMISAVGCQKADTSSDTSDTLEVSQSEEGFDIDNIDATQGGQSASTNQSSKVETSSGTTNAGISYGDVLDIDAGDNNQYPGRATDLKGKTVRVQFWQPYMSGTSTDTPLLTKRFKELCSKIEKQINCKIVMVEGWSNESGPSIDASVAAGKPTVDVWWVPSTKIAAAYANGYVTNLSDLKVFDFNDRSRFSHATEMCNIGGAYYGVAPRTYGKIPVFTNSVLYANIDLLEDCGVSLNDLRSWQKNKQWNWKKFREVAQKVKDNNGKNGYETYALNDTNTDFYQGLMISNGTDWVERDSKDTSKYTFTGGSNQGINVLKYYSELHKDGLITYSSTDQGTEFMQGKVAFYAGQMNKLTTEAGHWKFNFAVMYNPIGDDMDDYTSAGLQYSYACIPKGKKPSGCTDAEIATVINLINTSLLSEEEDMSQLASDLSFSIKNQLTNDTVYSIYNQPQKIAWSIMTYNIGLQTTNQTGGWFGKVHEIAQAGGANMTSVLNEITQSYNAKLSDIFK